MRASLPAGTGEVERAEALKSTVIRPALPAALLISLILALLTSLATMQGCSGDRGVDNNTADTTSGHNFETEKAVALLAASVETANHKNCSRLGGTPVRLGPTLDGDLPLVSRSRELERHSPDGIGTVTPAAIARTERSHLSEADPRIDG